MTAPIDPGDKDALYGIAMMKPYWRDAIAAVARAVCPPDCVVVRRDDLRALLNDIRAEFEGVKGIIGEERAARVDRLRSAIGEQG